ncbi:MAG: hypothetical protein L0Y64_27075 [Myxococcaceae bacterium]|nr:hypothetical protein [Myxococcaceae bacterium]
MSGYLWMGVQEDPELYVWLGRGLRVYDATRPPTEAEARLLATPHQRREPGTERGGLTLTGGGECVCGRCLWEWACPGVQP